MSRWFRYYEDALEDPKVQTLPAADFKGWVNILCAASRNDGMLPDMDHLAFALRMSVDACQTLVERLSNAGLIDTKSGGANGSHYAPHGWGKRQYKSDSSTERVKRFRHRSEAVSETPPDTDTETETESKKKNPSGRETAPASPPVRLVGKSPDAMVYDLGRKILGKSAGGVITKLRKECAYDDVLATEILNEAAEKSDPKAWVVKRISWLADRIYQGVDGYQAEMPHLLSRDEREWQAREAEIYAGVLY